MILTIVTAGPVCNLRYGGHVFRPVCLSVRRQDVKRCLTGFGKERRKVRP